MKQILFSLLLLTSTLQAGYTRVDGKWVHEDQVPTMSAQEHYDLGYQLLFEQSDWEKGLHHFTVITTNYKDSPFYADSVFYSGVCCFYRTDFDVANRHFSNYLDIQQSLKHFEEAFDYKFQIAECYRQGWRKHLFGTSRWTKFMSGKKDAIKLYDEIAASLPSQEIAAKSLYGKALLLSAKGELKEGIETLQTLIRRFPKHSLSAESYLLIAELYYDESKIESQNPDLLSLAQLNLQKFRKSFPSDERYDTALEYSIAMQDSFAKSLYDTGRFYERKKKPHASAIYYSDAIHKYPDTQSARKCAERLTLLGRTADNPLALQ